MIKYFHIFLMHTYSTIQIQIYNKGIRTKMYKFYNTKVRLLTVALLRHNVMQWCSKYVSLYVYQLQINLNCDRWSWSTTAYSLHSSTTIQHNSHNSHNNDLNNNSPTVTQCIKSLWKWRWQHQGQQGLKTRWANMFFLLILLTFIFKPLQHHDNASWQAWHPYTPWRIVTLPPHHRHSTQRQRKVLRCICILSFWYVFFFSFSYSFKFFVLISRKAVTTKLGPHDTRHVVWANSKCFFLFLSCFIKAIHYTPALVMF